MTSRTAYQQELTMNIADDTVPVKITASRRKSMSLKLNPKGVVDVRIPVGISKFQVLAFLGSHEDWLIKRYKQFKAIQQQRSQAVMIGGVEHTILKSMVKTLQVGDQVVLVPFEIGRASCRERVR